MMLCPLDFTYKASEHVRKQIKLPMHINVAKAVSTKHPLCGEYPIYILLALTFVSLLRQPSYEKFPIMG